MPRLFIINFEPSLGKNSQITDHLSKDLENILDWYSCFAYAVFVYSKFSAKELAEFIKQIDPENRGRFFVNEINIYTPYWGWMPDGAWEFIKRYSSTEKPVVNDQNSNTLRGY